MDKNIDIEEEKREFKRMIDEMTDEEFIDFISSYSEFIRFIYQAEDEEYYGDMPF